MNDFSGRLSMPHCGFLKNRNDYVTSGASQNSGDNMLVIPK